MKKVLFDGNFQDDILWAQMNECLFSAVLRVASEYKFFGLSNQTKLINFPKNVVLKNADFMCNENIWRNLILPLACLFNRNIPIYFPSGDVSNFLPASTPVVTMIKDISALDNLEQFENSKSEKVYRRKIQTNINRSDLVFVPTEYTKKRLQEEFYLGEVPVVLNFASLISSEYIDLPLPMNDERYFFVESQNVSPEGLNELLKIFIYMHTTKKNDAMLYLAGDFNITSSELFVNLEVARKIGVLREYNRLSSGQRAALMRGAIAAILPSKRDTLPIAHLDAMKCSCPIVTDKTPSVYEICEDAALYVDIYNMNEYCETLTRLEQDNIFRKDFIYKGLYREQAYSWDNSARIFLENLELACE